MKTICVPMALCAMLALAGCGDEAAPETAEPATGGEAAGEVLGGTISDEMIPLESLTSTSPPAERRVTTTTTTTNGGTTQTTVETTVESVNEEGEASAPAPTPPEPPATPEQ